MHISYLHCSPLLNLEWQHISYQGFLTQGPLRIAFILGVNFFKIKGDITIIKIFAYDSMLNSEACFCKVSH